jgi:hypothetical protein
MSKLTVLLLLSFGAIGPAAAAEGELTTPTEQASAAYRHSGRLSERHVVEVIKVSGTGSVRFVIGGHAFTAASGACGGWTAGDRVALSSGEWHGYCDTAVFRNLTRGRSCGVWCNGL